MRTHIFATFVGLALVGSVASAEITDLNGDLSIEAEVDALNLGTQFNDQSMASLQIDPDQDLGFQLDFNAVRSTGFFAGGTGGMVESSTSVMSNTSMYSFHHEMAGLASVGSNGADWANSEHGLRLNSYVEFEEGDQVLISMRIDYEAVQDGQLSAQFRLSGVSGSGPIELDVQDPTEAGFVEYSILTTVDSPRAFFLNADLDSRIEAFGDRPFAALDGFSMSASFVLVPAPGSALLFGGLGLFAGRRRRSSTL